MAQGKNIISMSGDGDIVDVYSAEEIQEKKQQYANVESEDFLKAFMDKGEGGEGKVWIKRLIAGSTAAQEHIAVFPLDKFSFVDLISYIQIKKGAGDYRFYIDVVDENGKTHRVGNKLIPISSPIDEPENKSLQTSSQETDRILQALENFKPKENPASFLQNPNTAEILKALGWGLGALSPIIIAMIKNRKQRDPMEFLERWIMIQPGMKEMFQQDEEKEESLSAIVDKYAGLLLPYLSKNPAAVPGEMPSNQASEVYAPYAHMFDALLPLALSGADAKQVALDYAQMCKGKDITPLLSWLNSESPLSFLLSYNSEFSAKADWCSIFIQELKLALQDQSDETLDAEK